jgi:hypothetical protein
LNNVDIIEQFLSQIKFRSNLFFCAKKCREKAGKVLRGIFNFFFCIEAMQKKRLATAISSATSERAKKTFRVKLLQPKINGLMCLAVAVTSSSFLAAL